MTLCNLTIEGGARAGLVAPDETTFDYLMGRPAAPKGGGLGDGAGLLEELLLRRGRAFRPRDRHRRRRRSRPLVTWGTSPEDVVAGRPARVPDPDSFADPGQARRRPTGRWTTWA